MIKFLVYFINLVFQSILFQDEAELRKKSKPNIIVILCICFANLSFLQQIANRWRIRIRNMYQMYFFFLFLQNDIFTELTSSRNACWASPLGTQMFTKFQQKTQIKKRNRIFEEIKRKIESGPKFAKENIESRFRIRIAAKKYEESVSGPSFKIKTFLLSSLNGERNI